MFEIDDSPVPGYRLIRKLGFGQYGVVWEAVGPGGTRVALKFIPIKDANGEVELKSIQYVKLIRHANLVPIHAIWLLDIEGKTLESSRLEKDIAASAEDTLVAEQLELDVTDIAYLVICMTLADGSLQDRLNDAAKHGSRGLPHDEVIDFMGQAARGLDFLNDQRHSIGNKTVGIQHRDIKPANLLLIGDTVVVGDFGVATALKHFDATATTALGSLAFMAPESIARRPSRSSDQYSMAITYYQLRSGQLPYDGSVSLPDLIDIHKTGKLDFALVSAAEKSVLRKATSIDPRFRYPSCRELVDALAKSVDQPAPGAQGLSGLVLGIVATIALIAISLIVWWNISGDDDPKVVKNLEPRVFNLTFEPADATHEITIRNADGDPAGAKIEGIGGAKMELQGSETVTIVARSTDPFHGEYNETLTIEQLIALAGKVELPELSTSQVREKSYKLLEGGEQAAAVQFLTDATQIDSTVLRMPAESVLFSNAPFPVNSIETVSNASFAIAMQDVGNHSVGILRKRDDGIEVREITLQDRKSMSFIEAILYHSKIDRLIIVRDDAIEIADISEDLASITNVWQQKENGPRVETIALSPDQRLLAIGYNDSSVRIWPVSIQGPWQEGKIDARSGQGPIVGLVFGPENRNITIFHDESPATRYQINGQGDDLTFDEQALEIPEHLTQSAIVGVSVLGTGAIAVATEKSISTSFDLFDSARPTFELLGNETNVDQIFPSKDGKWLLVGSRNDTPFQLWNVSQRRMALQASSAEIAGIWDVAFSDDGHRMAITSREGSIYLVNLELESPKIIKLFTSEVEYCKLIRFANDSHSLMGILDGRKNNGANISRSVYFDLKQYELDLVVAFEMTD